MNDDLISRQEVLDGIEELKKSPWATDKRGNGFEYLIAEALDVVADLCVKQASFVNPQEPNIVALGEDMRIFRESITDEKVLIGFNMAVALCNKHLRESEDKE